MSPADAGPVSRPLPRRHLRAALGGALAAAAVLGLRGAGVLTGPPALLLAVLLLLAVPTAERLSRRTLLTGSIGLGWTVAAWWWPLAGTGPGRGVWALALLAGGLAAWVLAGDAGPRLRRLVPVVRPSDLLPAACVAVASYLLLPWLRVGDDAAALSLLQPGWDNSAHVDMVLMLRDHGVTVSALGPAPGGETWKFTEYPQAFHALVATVLDLLLPGAAPAPVATVVQAGTVVLVLAVGVLAAGVCALPALRDRPAAALVATAVVGSAYLLGPGATTLPAGFPNFLLAAVLTSCVALVVVDPGDGDGLGSPVALLAVGGLLVGVAHTWVLLLSLALPAAALLLLPWDLRRWPPDPRGRLLPAAVVVVTLLGGLQAARLLAGLDAGAVLATPGGIEEVHVGALVTVLVTAVAAAAVALVALRGGGTPAARTATLRAGAAGAVALAAVGVGALLAAVQLRTWGALTYYFWKYALGVELVAVVLAVVAASAVLEAVSARRPLRGRTVPAVAALVAAAGASQAFGVTGIPGTADPVRATAPGVVQRTLAADRAARPSAAALELLAATAAPVPEGAHGVLLRSTADLHPISVQQWYLALTGSWTEEANHRAEALAPAGPTAGTPPTVPPVPDRAVQAVAADPAAVVVVPPGELPAVRAALGDDAARAVSW